MFNFFKSIKSRIYTTSLIAILISIIFMVTSSFSVDNPDEECKIIINNKPNTDNDNSNKNELPVVGNKEKLEDIIKNNSKYMNRTPNLKLFEMEDSQEIGNSSNQKSSEDHSKTNTQVDGVDEADVVKTDGNYIYHVNKNRLLITNIDDPKNMKIVKKIDFKDDFYVTELYADSNNLTIIGSQNIKIESYLPQIDKDINIDDTRNIMPSTNFVKVMVFDISDKTNIKQVRDFEIEGNYISSRKINNNLYIISNKNIFNYIIYPNSNNNSSILEKSSEALLVPIFKDRNGYKKISYDDIHYFPDSPDANYLNVSSIDVTNSKKDTKIQTYLGSGNNIYCSLKNLYVSVNFYDTAKNNEKSKLPENGLIYYNNLKTLIYKFSLDKLDVNYQSKGEVPGSILNQFSMDEKDDYFRLATTENGQTQKNNLYIMDKNMKTIGKINNIAPGEQIYSVRFMNDRAYIVTFKTVDPLFVIDIKNPTSPKILGSLKIPGFSDYLHPFDDNHIIGFGKDTIEKNGSAYHMGLKMALFDVSDVSNPKQKFQEIIGDRGSDSELLRNHKALLFMKEKNFLAFPLTITKNNDNIKNDSNDNFD
ncbi:MAG: beta-propeller domain-containing protein, partial [Clostridiales bacterium]